MPLTSARARSLFLALVSLFTFWSLGTAIGIAAQSASQAQPKRRPAARRRTAAPVRRRAPRRPPLDPNHINDPKLTDAVGPGSNGDAVVRAEILLDRAKFSPGEISDTFSENAQKAVAAFQKQRGLPVSGTVDDPTWQALNGYQIAIAAPSQLQPLAQNQQAAGQQPNQPPPNQPAQNPSGGAVQPGSSPPNNNQAAPHLVPSQNGNNQLGGNASQAQRGQPNPTQGQPMPANGNNVAQKPAAGPPAIAPYTITPEDVAGPFTKIPRARGEQLMMAEAKLEHLNYSSPLEALSAKFHSSPKLLTQLNSGKNFGKVGEEILAPNVLTPVPGQAASVVVDGDDRSVSALDAQGKLLAYYPATIGSEHDPLPVGDWKILGKRPYPRFHYDPNLFWDAENKHARAVLPPGPKSPVGVVWISLSKEHYGIHGTPEPSLIGKTHSHGCIRLTNWDAEELAQMVQPGTPAILKGSGQKQSEQAKVND